jgi:hypothetical protein
MAKVITAAQFRETTCKALRAMADRIEADQDLRATLERNVEPDDGSGWTHETVRVTVSTRAA